MDTQKLNMPMKKKILERYSCTQDNQLILDITSAKVEDLYNDFDKSAPYIKKDLDQDLVEYIIDFVSEIGAEDFVIQFRFTKTASSELTSRVAVSVKNYFQYLKALESRKFAKLTRSSFILSAIGIVILCVSVWINQIISGHGAVINHVFSEGLNVAAWVSLWNAIAIFLVNWSPHHQQIKIYERISKAAIFFPEDTSEK